MSYETIIAVCVAVIGWFAVNIFAKRRDHLNKRRDLRVQYLIDAYRTLETASNRDTSLETMSRVESAIADIQLFGTKNQVTLAQDFAVQFASDASASLDDLLIDLRQDLRSELQLDEVSNTIKYLRYKTRA